MLLIMNFDSFTSLPTYYQLKDIESDISKLAFKLAFLNDSDFNTDTFYKQLCLFHNRLVFYLTK